MSDKKPARAAASARKAKPKGRKLWKKIGLGALITFLVLGIVGTVGIVVAYNNIRIPDPNADFQTNNTTVMYADGQTKLGGFAVQNRQSIPYDKMPQSIKDATIAAENRTFWTDPGISIPGMFRAGWAIVTGGEVQGGSTITQQYIKILYLTSERTMTRKAKELLLAVKLNKEVPKEQILEGYLNTIYFGRGAYGVQAASRAFFNTDAAKLTVPQSAVLASVLNNPSLFDPSGGKNNIARLTDRYHYVLDGMREIGTITAAQHAEYSKSLPTFPNVPISDRYGGPKGFLLHMVEQELIAAGISPGDIHGGGLRILTTIDKPSQDAAVATAQKYEKEAASAANKPAPGIHATIASIDNATGGIRALYGGADFVKNSRNWATTPRMAASTFKTFNLAAGLEDGFTLRSLLRGNTFTPRGDGVPVRNEFNHQYGEVTLRKATADSINTAFVDLTQQMDDGPNKIVKAANAAGAPTGEGWDLNNRIGLGSAEVSAVDMANAYATYANNGMRHQRHIVAEVRDADGKVMYQGPAAGKRAVEEDISRDVTYALTSVVQSGTGSRVAALDRPIAGKTGTAGVGEEIRTAWFVAYTKQVSTAVLYVAGDDGNGDLDPYKRPGDGTFFGGTYPAMTWLDFMKVATDGQKVEQFDPPAYVNRDKPKGEQQPVETHRPKSDRPTETSRPTKSPSPSPTAEPAPPSPQPTQPTDKPTPKPTTAPTNSPTAEPTGQPTRQPKPPPRGKPQPQPRPSDRPGDGGG